MNTTVDQIYSQLPPPKRHAKRELTPEEVNLATWTSVITGRRGMDERAALEASIPTVLAADPATARILVVDDEPINVQVVAAFLEDAGYQNIRTFTNSVEALISVERDDFDVALLDVMMPQISGLDLLKQINESARHADVPVIILTASTERSLKSKALELGAADFLNKPFDPEELLARTENALIRKAHFDHIQSYARELEEQVQRRTAELVSSQMQLVHCLGRAAEYRDNETGLHVVRVGRFSSVIACELGLDAVMVRQIELAATLHDIGKIGLPDSILLKPGRLDPDELERMREHALLGEEIVSPARSRPSSHGVELTLADQLLYSFDSPLMRMAATIAATHHEKWDGSGYPHGLAGEDIPLEGRIVAVADVYDALSSKRPYKEAFPDEKCVAILEEGRGQHFDPTILDAFMARHDEIRQIAIHYTDDESIR